MTTGEIDLKKNPDAAEVVADLPIGASIVIYATIKAKDDQTLSYAISSIEEGSPEDDEDEETEGAMSSDSESMEDEPIS